MPLKRCSENEKSGWKWGDSGKCTLEEMLRKKPSNKGLP